MLCKIKLPYRWTSFITCIAWIKFLDIGNSKLRNWVIQDGRLAQFASCWKGELRCKLLHLWSKTLDNDCPNGHITTKYTLFILYYSWLQSIMMLACQTQVKGFVSDNRGYWWHYRSHSNRAWQKGIVFTPTNQQYMEIVIIMIVIYISLLLIISEHNGDCNCNSNICVMHIGYRWTTVLGIFLNIFALWSWSNIVLMLYKFFVPTEI